ncbi:hypothetical protein LZ554_002741 [Drepanopeziza brunnea f. sp. 'monogermtubi']|nr:hypothetical protein LZ554_002741 [Drepanopeziza brunnea f. sp. 'monogermtubi']
MPLNHVCNFETDATWSTYGVNWKHTVINPAGVDKDELEDGISSSSPPVATYPENTSDSLSAIVAANLAATQAELVAPTARTASGAAHSRRVEARSPDDVVLQRKNGTAGVRNRVYDEERKSEARRTML